MKQIKLLLLVFVTFTMFSCRKEVGRPTSPTGSDSITLDKVYEINTSVPDSVVHLTYTTRIGTKYESNKYVISSMAQLTSDQCTIVINTSDLIVGNTTDFSIKIWEFNPLNNSIDTWHSDLSDTEPKLLTITEITPTKIVGTFSCHMTCPVYKNYYIENGKFSIHR